jgi:lipid-A-disaccharide synthase
MRRVALIDTVILANLVAGERFVPEFLQQACTPENLAGALSPLLGDTLERRRQTEIFDRFDAFMEIGGDAPSERAAGIVLDLAAGRPVARPTHPRTKQVAEAAREH